MSSPPSSPPMRTASPPTRAGWGGERSGAAAPQNLGGQVDRRGVGHRGRPTRRRQRGGRVGVERNLRVDQDHPVSPTENQAPQQEHKRNEIEHQAAYSGGGRPRAFVEVLIHARRLLCAPSGASGPRLEYRRGCGGGPGTGRRL